MLAYGRADSGQALSENPRSAAPLTHASAPTGRRDTRFAALAPDQIAVTIVMKRKANDRFRCRPVTATRALRHVRVRGRGLILLVALAPGRRWVCGCPLAVTLDQVSEVRAGLLDLTVPGAADHGDGVADLPDPPVGGLHREPGR